METQPRQREINGTGIQEGRTTINYYNTELDEENVDCDA
jgi:hypothetical protein